MNVASEPGPDRAQEHVQPRGAAGSVGLGDNDGLTAARRPMNGAAGPESHVSPSPQSGDPGPVVDGVSQSEALVYGAEENRNGESGDTSTGNGFAQSPTSPGAGVPDMNSGEWETVGRKPRAGAIAPPKSGPASSSFSSQTTVDKAPTLSGQQKTERQPEDTHVVVIRPEDDPRIQADGDSGGDQLSEGNAPRKAAVVPAPWSKSAASGGVSLVEIQRQEEVRSKAQAVAAQNEEASSARQKVQTTPAQPWGGAAAAQPPVKMSLREQMRIEEERKEQEAAAASVQRTAVVGAPIAKTGWASLVANSKPAAGRPGATVVIGKSMEDESQSFWDSVTSNSTAVGRPAARPARASPVPLPVAAPSPTTPPGTAATVSVSSSRRTRPARGATAASNPTPPVPPRSTPEVQSASPATSSGGKQISTEFVKWCMQSLKALTGGADAGFVDYLVGIRSSNEIRETLLQNLGTNDKATAFADEFIRRVEFERSSERADAGGSTANGGGGRKKGRRRQTVLTL